jgi:hypothetical protein
MKLKNKKNRNAATPSGVAHSLPQMPRVVAQPAATPKLFF